MEIEDKILIGALREIDAKLRELGLWISKKHETSSFKGVVILEADATKQQSCQVVIDELVMDLKNIVGGIGKSGGKIPEDLEG